MFLRSNILWTSKSKRALYKRPKKDIEAENEELATHVYNIAAVRIFHPLKYVTCTHKHALL